MSTDNAAALKGRHRYQAESKATDTRSALQAARQSGWDARDVLAGRVDDTTVRQAAEGGL